MVLHIKIKGKVTSGVGKGKGFVEIDWVSEGIKRLLGFKPFPGTLNVKVSKENFSFISKIKDEGLTLRSPVPGFCNAMLVKASIGGLPCALVFPEESRWIHKNTFEIIAEDYMRKRLGLENGSEVEIDIFRIFIPDLVIFDLDGTVVNSVPFFFEAAKKISEKCSFSFEIFDLRNKMNEKMSFWNAFLFSKKEKEAIRRLYVESCHVFPGIKDVILGLKAKGLKTALLTENWDLETVEAVLKKDGIDFRLYFDFASSFCDSKGKKKTLKEELKKIVGKLSSSFLKTVYVGDSKGEMETAKKLGMATVGVLTGVACGKELFESNADVVVSDVKDLQRVIEELPC